MKIALISDIHGNIDALEAVLKDAQVQGSIRRIANCRRLTATG